jgi:hypothetical protein
MFAHADYKDKFFSNHITYTPITPLTCNNFKRKKDSNTLLECKFDTPLPCTTDLFLREEALDRDATCE